MDSPTAYLRLMVCLAYASAKYQARYTYKHYAYKKKLGLFLLFYDQNLANKLRYEIQFVLSVTRELF